MELNLFWVLGKESELTTHIFWAADVGSKYLELEELALLITTLNASVAIAELVMAKICFALGVMFLLLQICCVYVMN